MTGRRGRRKRPSFVYHGTNRKKSVYRLEARQLTVSYFSFTNDWPRLGKRGERLCLQLHVVDVRRPCRTARRPEPGCAGGESQSLGRRPAGAGDAARPGSGQLANGSSQAAVRCEARPSRVAQAGGHNCFAQPFAMDANCGGFPLKCPGMRAGDPRGSTLDLRFRAVLTRIRKGSYEETDGPQ